MIISPQGWPYVEDEDLVTDWPVASKVAADRFDALAALEASRSAPVLLSGNRATALPGATATVVNMTDVDRAGTAGSGVRAGTEAGQPGWFVRVDEPCTLLLTGIAVPALGGDSWRVPMWPAVVDATPGDWFGVGALIAGTRLQAAYMNRNVVAGIWGGSADHTLPSAHAGIGMSLLAYRLT